MVQAGKSAATNKLGWGDILDTLTKALSGLGYTTYTIIAAIVFIFTVSFITMLRVRGTYRRLQKELRSVEARRDSRFRSKLLSDIVEDYRNVSVNARGEINTQAIVEKNFGIRLKGLLLGERFVRNSISLMIVLGLLGTFYGLTLSVGKLVELLSENGNSELLVGMDSVITGLISAVKGMAVAFSTSLAGVSGSIIITILGIIVNIEEARQGLMVQIEDYLDNVVEQELLPGKETELSRVSAAITGCFDGFSLRVENMLRETVTDFSEKLSEASGNIMKASEGLEGNISRFEKALGVFAENTRDFSEFNYNLRGNIERLDVSFSNLREDLSEAAGMISESHKAIGDFSDSVLQAAAVISGNKGDGDGR